MASVSTHVLDTSRGIPADGVAVSLFRVDPEGRTHIASATTNPDGRIGAPLPKLEPGIYTLVFEVERYFRRFGTESFYDEITVRFHVTDDGRHYHVPLLLSPWSYSTYRGS
ncbi:MAG TPA: hydroxyisourate hydrolase [Candidatus Elarobacter sp.]|jgi:5-hydroxyisourate hydrolase